MSKDTIFAIASGTSRAAIAVLRLSGPATPQIVARMAGKLPPPRAATLAKFIDPASDETIDRGLVVFFPAPRSFTGEDCAEFHIHGGRAVAARLIAAIGAFPGARPAKPGEFTRRALLNGKMDLAEVEGLADLIQAETEWQRRQALRQMEGRLSRQAEDWRRSLLEAAALIEAEIDFSDEAAVPPETSRKIGEILAPVRDALLAELAAGRVGERIREGLVIVIAGPPNAGKSTLLNALARRDIAIVSPEAGTTRDAIEVHLDLDGCPVILIDTAGLRDSADSVEAIGVARALEKAKGADLVLWLSELAAPQAAPESFLGLETWPILTKSEFGKRETTQDALAISAATGNLDLLIARLSDFARRKTGEGFAGLITRERHRLAFQASAEALSRILNAPEAPVELLAEDLRAAAFALQKITGLIDVEDILGEIFSRFCIGK
ncbi:tRNA uridine-5-carboxymethylaminomethyl(34) synthesis GTPase MnmE [Methylocapsa acidiphila]|uniref:tRNA uridine-5-carboxymethylaminomethyl(34) synthesis GTPase MnmE n=1 Tax=Methylocapsa acidiphila TaxID=133552 RepID=UPI000413978B|nr:tRNA uridine-5-carboxymethylaminomethyl(34) synthesis GTPase MnmE [Methylocapsa acidiphila]